MSEPLRLMVYDATCARGPLATGLSTVWRTGGALYDALGRLDARRGVRSWDEALAWLAEVEPGRAIGEVQYWGHGTWGRVWIDREALDVNALAPGHALHAPLLRVRARMNPSSLWWFRTCETFGTAAGQRFAREWTGFFNCRAAGHTYVIGALQSGLHSLGPGETPRWPVDEGLPPGVPSPRSALGSHPRAVHTISFLQGAIPAGY